MQRALVFMLVVAAGLGGCRCGPQPVRSPPADLRAVVEAKDGLELLEHRGGGWESLRVLPGSARAFRASANGRHLAWIEDTTLNGVVSMEGWLLLDGQAPTPLGPLALREHEAFGLAVDDVGRALFLAKGGIQRPADAPVGDDGAAMFLAKDGTRRLEQAAAREGGTEPACGSFHCFWVKEGCLVAPMPFGPVCGEALRPLDVRSLRVLARTNAVVVVADTAGVGMVPMTDVLEGRFGPYGDWLIVRRVQDGGRVQDALLVGPEGSTPTEVLRDDIVAQARFLGSGRIVAIREAGGAMDNLLAHAPEEFGGERLAGEAIVVDPATRAVAPVPGLEGRKVRALIPLTP